VVTGASVRHHGRMRRLLVLVTIFAVGCATAHDGTPNPAFCASLQWRADIGRASLRVEIADDDTERQRGLMGVTSLPKNEGMAFVWDAPTDGTFWMKDTLIPLSIAFVGADGRIVTLRDMAPCTADPCQTYAATAPYTTAIEANAGWFDARGIQVGDEVGLKEPTCS
jgi:uncharacterized protein